MKAIISISLIASALTIAVASAAVPSLINYQGRLTDSSGDPVTGSKNFSLSIFDASASGTLLYTENIGAITLDNKGIYSFQFGATGTSNSSTSETVGTTDGTTTTFPKVLDNAPIVADSLSVTDGTYTWSQTAGSSDDNEFGVVYSEAQGRVTVIYYSAAPAAGAEITASYRYGTSGITGALNGDSEQWLELSVDGTPQAARDRLLTVPYAARAAIAEKVTTFDEDLLQVTTSTLSNLIDDVAFSGFSDKSYVFENFPTESGQNGLVDNDYLKMTWDSTTNTLTTRGIVRSSGRVYGSGLNLSWPILGNVSQMNVQVSYQTSRMRASLEFIYGDGSLSPPLSLQSSSQLVSNPAPEKIVSSVRVKIWQTSGSGDSCQVVSCFPIYLPGSRSADFKITPLNTAHALRLLADGYLSDAGDFGECCQWLIRYSDDSLSSAVSIGGVIQLDESKTAVAVRIQTIPTVILNRAFDLDKIMVRYIAH